MKSNKKQHLTERYLLRENCSRIHKVCYNASMKRKVIKKIPSFLIEFERENDKRWIADIPRLPGVMAYGSTKNEARKKVFAIALRTLADKVERGTTPTPVARLFTHEMARS